MRVLVCGTGAEDARHPLWGHVVSSLERSGHEVWSYDSEVAVRNDRTNDPLPALVWLLDEIRPERVYLVDALPSVRALLESRQLDLRPLTAAELGAACHVELLAPAATIDADEPTEPTEPDLDVVVAGYASLDAVRSLVALAEAGYSVYGAGDGWHGVAALHGSTGSALPFPLLGDMLRRGRRVLAVGPEGSRQALEAAAAGRPVLTGDSPAAVVAAMSAPADATTVLPADAIPSWTARWRRELSPEPVVVREFTPRVSFFVPTYNNGRFLAECVDSILGQTVPEVEVILLNDGSTDGTAELMPTLARDPRVRTVDQANVGQRDRFDFLCRRTINLARGEFLAALGSDDKCAPDRVATQLEVFDADPETQICLGGGLRIGPDGEDQGETFKLWYSFSERTLLRDLANGNFLAHPTMMARSSVHDLLGPMEEGFSTDVHLWWKAAGRMRFRYLPRHLVSYRHHSNGSSTNLSGGHLRGFRRGRQCHHLELTRRGLQDVYPELRRFPTPEARAAAELELANRLMRHYPETSIAALERAAAELGRPHPAVLHNLTLATLMAGDSASAKYLAKRSGLPQTQTVLQAFMENPTERALADGQFTAQILSAEFAEALATPTDAIMWDGMPEYVQRVLVIPNPQRPDLLDGLLRRWAQVTRPGTPMTMIIPTLGQAPGDVAALVVDSAARVGVDLDNCADLCIEGIDSLALLPSDYLSGVILLDDDSELADGSAVISRLATKIPAPRKPSSLVGA